MKDAGVETAHLDWLVLHQANQRILDAAAQRLGVSPERVVSNLAEYGNTSAASIPLALDEAVRGGKIKPGDTVSHFPCVLARFRFEFGSTPLDSPLATPPSLPLAFACSTPLQLTSLPFAVCWVQAGVPDIVSFCMLWAGHHNPCMELLFQVLVHLNAVDQAAPPSPHELQFDSWQRACLSAELAGLVKLQGLPHQLLTVLQCCEGKYVCAVAAWSCWLRSRSDLGRHYSEVGMSVAE